VFAEADAAHWAADHGKTAEEGIKVGSAIARRRGLQPAPLGNLPPNVCTPAYLAAEAGPPRQGQQAQG